MKLPCKAIVIGTSRELSAYGLAFLKYGDKIKIESTSNAADYGWNDRNKVYHFYTRDHSMNKDRGWYIRREHFILCQKN